MYYCRHYFSCDFRNVPSDIKCLSKFSRKNNINRNEADFSSLFQQQCETIFQQQAQKTKLNGFSKWKTKLVCVAYLC